MNVLIVGATGRTGIRVVKEVSSRGHHPIALVRESSDTCQLPKETEVRQGDLTNLPNNTCDGCEVIVFVVGSGGNTDAQTTDNVDRDGAINLIDLANKAGTKLFVMLSTIGAGDLDPNSDLYHYLKAKHVADEHLMASGLEYAILRLFALTDSDGHRNTRFGNHVAIDATAARGDVAALLARAVDEDEWLGKALRMQSVGRFQHSKNIVDGIEMLGPFSSHFWRLRNAGSFESSILLSKIVLSLEGGDC